MHIWKWLVEFPLANSCCPPAEIGVGAQATWSLFVVVVVDFSLFATTTLPRIGLNWYTVYNNLFQANVFVKYISMESAEGNEFPFSYVNCFKNCLCHLFDGNVWSTSSRIGFLEGEGGFGLAADVFGWRNSNLKLHLLKKPVHNFVCVFFFFFPSVPEINFLQFFAVCRCPDSPLLMVACETRQATEGCT